MNQTTRLPSRKTALSTQMRRIIERQRANRAATSPGMYTSQTVDGVFRRPKARVGEASGTGSAAYYA